MQTWLQTKFEENAPFLTFRHLFCIPLDERPEIQLLHSQPDHWCRIAPNSPFSLTKNKSHNIEYYAFSSSNPVILIKRNSQPDHWSRITPNNPFSGTFYEKSTILNIMPFPSKNSCKSKSQITDIGNQFLLTQLNQLLWEKVSKCNGR